MKKNKLLIFLLVSFIVVLIVLGILFATGKLSTKSEPKKENISWTWPTESEHYIVVLNYGKYEAWGNEEWSPGIDIARGEGTNIYAAYDGKVVIKESDDSYGNYIMIDHNNGYYTLYAYLKDFAPGIEEGTIVQKGQVIGYMGSTGWATGIYLHFEVRTCPEQNCTVDPMTLFNE